LSLLRKGMENFREWKLNFIWRFMFAPITARLQRICWKVIKMILIYRMINSFIRFGTKWTCFGCFFLRHSVCVCYAAVSCPTLALRAVSTTETTVGTVVNVSCPAGQKLQTGLQTTTTLCVLPGVWSPQIPDCVGKLNEVHIDRPRYKTHFVYTIRLLRLTHGRYIHLILGFMCVFEEAFIYDRYAY